MTLDEAIRHCEEVAEEKRYEYQDCLEANDREAAKECVKCGLQHRQLAEWLKELKDYKEQDGDTISRQAAIDVANQYWYKPDIAGALAELPPAQPKQMNSSENPNNSDTIYRQAAIDAVLDRMDAEKHGRNAKPEEIRWALERLPSAQPKIKTGHWVPKDLKWECNHCGCRIRRANPFSGNLWNYYYCPNCGYRMNPLNGITSEVQNESPV